MAREQRAREEALRTMPDRVCVLETGYAAVNHSIDCLTSAVDSMRVELARLAAMAAAAKPAGATVAQQPAAAPRVAANTPAKKGTRSQVAKE